MSLGKRIVLIIAAVVALGCALLIPDWFEDPAKLAIGEWRGVPNGIQAEVEEQVVFWQVGGHQGKFAYSWVQTENEPYRVLFRRGSRVFEADVVFNGADEVVLSPLIFDQLPEMAQQYIRSRNKAKDRPEEEMLFLFNRRKQKK